MKTASSSIKRDSLAYRLIEEQGRVKSGEGGGGKWMEG